MVALGGEKMNQTTFGVHEIVDLRELINFKGCCLTEAKTRLSLVENPELKVLVEQSVQQGTSSVQQMQSLLTVAATQLKQEEVR